MSSRTCHIAINDHLTPPRSAKAHELQYQSSVGKAAFTTRLRFQYHVPFIMAAQRGGMEAVAQDPYWANRIELAMRTIEENGNLREACDAVATAMLAQPLASLWGDGVAASADMMSLDATRHLWNARIEPRRSRLVLAPH